MKTKNKKILTKINEDCVESRVYYTLYTLVFVVMTVCIYWYFLKCGKSFVEVSGYDGLTQHYTFLSYYGRYLREIVYNIFVDHSFTIPMFDFHIGFGDDIVTTLSYYVMGDPFAFLSVFVPMKDAEFLYNALILLRVFFAGISFSMYCRYHGFCSLYTLAGSMIYIFSGTTIYSAIYHPYFMNPLIWLPLVFMAIDKILSHQKGGKRQYILLIAIMGLSNFYFFYMLCLLVMIYTIYRYIMIHDTFAVKEIGKEVTHFVLYSLLGIGMAFVLFFPAMHNILSLTRVSGGGTISLLYEPYYYIKFIPSFISSTMGVHYERMGYTAVGLVAVIALIIRSYQKPVDKTKKFLRNGLFMLLIFMCVPLFGSIFNGMGYATNRFVFALAFLVALIVTVMLPELFALQSFEVKILFMIDIVLAILVFAMSIIRTNKFMVAVLSVWIVMSVILGKNRNLLSMGKRILSIIMTCTLLVLNAFLTYCPTEENIVNNYLDTHEPYKYITDNTPAMALADGEAVTERYDTAGISMSYRNCAMIGKKLGTAWYYSTCAQEVSNVARTMYLNNLMDFSNNNLQHRTYLDALMSVKYFVVKQGEKNNIPYGFNQFVRSSHGYDVYQSKYQTGIALTSDQWIPSEEYDKMSITQKQQALLQGIVTDSDCGISKANLSFDAEQCDYRIQNIKDLRIEGNTIRVTNTDASLELSFFGLERSECYAIFDNLHYEGTRKADGYSKEQIQSMSHEQKTDMVNSKLRAEPSSADVVAEDGQDKCSLTLYAKNNQFYCDKNNFLLNMGYQEQARNKITLTFKQTGIYTFDSLSVVCQPMSSYDRDMSERQKHIVDDVKFGTNCVDLTVEETKDTMLLLTLPYNEGWKATVDGKPVEVQKADGLFMAVKLPAGSNKVHFQYSNRYFVTGAIVSVVCWAGFGVACVYDIQRRKRNKNRGE